MVVKLLQSPIQDQLMDQQQQSQMKTKMTEMRVQEEAK